MPRTLIALAGVCLALWTTALPAAGTGDELIEAVQRQQVERARELLAAGVDVNHKTRYGATALFFACDKGNVELVKLLLERGAEVDVTDTFYNATPLTWTLFNVPDSPAHKEIALLILEKGAADADEALTFGARGGDLDLVKAVVEKGEIEPAAILSALQLAEASKHEEIAGYLKKHSPEEEAAETLQVPPEKLATYVGDYKNDDIGMSAKVFMDGDDLKIQAAGQSALTLDATDENAFTAREASGIDFTFQGRGGLIEGFQLQQGGQELYFPRVEAAAAPEVAEKPEELPPLPEPERGKPVPWPRFRGSGASGIADGQGAPSNWNVETKENLRWKTPIPGLGNSSPVIWGNRVFITTAVSKDGDDSLRTGLYGDVDSVEDDSKHSWKVYALDKESGRILWERTASEGAPKAKRHLKSTHANPTPATDGRHLVVFFASEGLFCYDLDGDLKWKKDLGLLSSGWFYDATYEWGFSSSPILHDGKVIVQVDIHEASYIAAYELATGRELWKTERDEIPTWGTPAVLPVAEGQDAEIVTNGTTVRGYDAGNGKELWSLSPNSEITVASPVISGGIAYVTGGYAPVRPIYAIKPGGRGDLTLTEDEKSSEHVLWSESRGGTYIPTPIVYRGLLYILHNNGRLAAHDAATGELHYRERVGSAASFSGSPVAADGRLFFTTEEGKTFVVRAGKDYQVLATNELDEVVMTSPAISDGLLVMRGARHVYGLGEKQEPSEEPAPGSR